VSLVHAAKVGIKQHRRGDHVADTAAENIGVVVSGADSRIAFGAALLTN